MQSIPKTRGQQAEHLAARFLIAQQFEIVAHQFHSRFGEIDLIARDPAQHLLIFAEVRYRRHTQFGTAEETITKSKQQKLLKTALFFLLENPHYKKYHQRFDVLAMNGTLTETFNWIQGAFSFF
jgi:putative endonuclease